MIQQNFDDYQAKLKKDNFDKKAYQRAMEEKTLQDNRDKNEKQKNSISELMHREKS